MADRRDELAANSGWSELVRRIRARSPARILAGRAGAAYRTETQIQLREDHAAARDAVRAEFDLNAALGARFVERWKLFEVRTRASTKEEYLLHPSLGRESPGLAGAVPFAPQRDPLARLHPTTADRAQARGVSEVLPGLDHRRDPD